ncbi:MAG: hypothetical protein ACE5IK_10805 [Acidobacteriota bacterium]
MRRSRAGLVAALLLVALGIPARGAGPDDRIAVLPLANLTGEKSFYWLGEAFAEGVSDQLLAAGMAVVPPARRRGAARELGLAPDRASTLASDILLARRLNASLLVVGEVRWEESRHLRIEGRILRADAPSIDEPIVLRGELNDLYKMQKQLAHLLLPTARGRNAQAQIAPLAALTDVPLSSFEAYIKAVTASDRPAREAFLDRSLAADPSFAPALIARARLDLDDGKAREARLWLDRIAVERMAFPERYWLARGDTAAARGDRGSAFDLYGKALALRDWPLAHFHMAAVLAQQGKLLDARQQVEAGLLADPSHPLGIELREALTHSHTGETPS